EDPAAVGRPHEHDQVHVRDVHAFVEEINSAQDVDLSSLELAESAVPVSRGGGAIKALDPETEEPEGGGEVVGVLHARREDQRGLSALLAEAARDGAGGFLVARWNDQAAVELAQGVA